MGSLQITSKESETARNLRVLGKAAKHTNVREAGSAKLSQAMAEWLRGLRLTMFRHVSTMADAMDQQRKTAAFYYHCVVQFYPN